MRLVLVALASWLLCGCWFGPYFYTAADATPALAPGTWRIADRIGTVDGEFRVAIMPDGMTRLEPLSGTDEAIVAGFAPLGGDGRHFVTWSLPRRSGSMFDRVAVYGLLVRDGDGARLYVPECRQTRRIARAAGARIHRGEMDECGFGDRASLEAAFRRLVARPGQLGEPQLTLVPARNR